MEFSGQEYWSGLPFPSPGDLRNPGIEPESPTLKADSLPSEPAGKPGIVVICLQMSCLLKSAFPGRKEGCWPKGCRVLLELEQVELQSWRPPRRRSSFDSQTCTLAARVLGWRLPWIKNPGSLGGYVIPPTPICPFLSRQSIHLWREMKVAQLCPTLCDSPWDSPGQNTGVGNLSHLQEIIPTQGLNPGLRHCRQILY